jgi:hypothetical protein
MARLDDTASDEKSRQHREKATIKAESARKTLFYRDSSPRKLICRHPEAPAKLGAHSNRDTHRHCGHFSSTRQSAAGFRHPLAKG